MGKTTEPTGPDTEECPYAVVLAYDPGGTTGWSVFAVHPVALSDPGYSVLENVVHWEHGQFSGPEPEVIRQCIDMADAWPGAALVIEDFVMRAGKGVSSRRDLLSPVRITAAVEYHVWAYGGRRMFRQQPAVAKTAVTDSRLRSWRLWNRDGAEHARDADRHALLFLRRSSEDTRRAAALRQVAWPQHFKLDKDSGDGGEGEGGGETVAPVIPLHPQDSCTA